MLPKKKRISTEMFKVTGVGKTYHSPLFSVRKSKITANHSHFAVVVSSKVARTAVKRNLVRRRMYEAIQKLESKMPSPFAYIFFMKKESLAASYKDLELSLQSLPL